MTRIEFGSLTHRQLTQEPHGVILSFHLLLSCVMTAWYLIGIWLVEQGLRKPRWWRPWPRIWRSPIWPWWQRQKLQSSGWLLNWNHDRMNFSRSKIIKHTSRRKRVVRLHTYFFTAPTFTLKIILPSSLETFYLHTHIIVASVSLPEFVQLNLTWCTY